ncbi:hypothetical protein RD055328_06420 [Companilactobacillus sp. RD055328]|uniref:DNA-processing protein DprA n=1 Tax=Companilactobacillus sp. RD055328 TaxID=2916634 RepID=UPI001FC84CA0|nr:DNA-processing protein DprA [Companilactobacillus sp. RD055328]GKQ42719.1 hypothetical protein RD055328_06420 [Companilactobacillus sp. RD055328]
MNNLFAKIAATEVLSNKELLVLLKMKDLTINNLIHQFPNKASKIIRHDNYQNFEELNLQMITFLDEDYPDKLREVYNPPAILYYRGELSLLNKTSIGIVGARLGTEYSQKAIEKICRRLSNDKVIISGMAKGVDTMAHLGALNNNLKTIAVMGTGIDGCYPTKNRKLKQRIEQMGLIISEYPTKHVTKPYNFVERNRIIAGLSNILIITEAKKKSGSLITASLALENNREVYALPGSNEYLLSQGTNELIRDGAQVLLL